MRHFADIDILPRFSAIYAALRVNGDWRDRPAWLRFAAQIVVRCPLDPTDIAKRIRTAADILRKHAGWFSDLSSPWRFVLAALLVQDGIDVEVFAAGLSGDHDLFRRAGLRHGGMYETMAIAILRHLNAGSLDHHAIDQLQQLYTGLKRHHWWLAGPDDMPACACLTAVKSPPGLTVLRIEDNLTRLRGSGFTLGNHLLHAACLLALPDLPEGAAATRFTALATAFNTIDGKLWHEDYDAVALLCLLDHHPKLIVQRVREYIDALLKQEPALQGQATFNLAADFTLLDLARCDRNGVRLHTGADFSRMLATLHLSSAASLLLSTGSQSIATSELADWPNASPLAPMGGPHF